MPSGQPLQRRAFTLIEVLIVLAIIAVLSAILFPVFAHVRKKGYQATCQSNLKQIGLVIQQYSQDHDATYPSLCYFLAAGYDRHAGLPVQVKTRQILWCPSGLQPYTGTWSLSFCGNGVRYPNPPPTGLKDCESTDTNYRYNEVLLTDLIPGIGSKEAKFQNVQSLILVDDSPFVETGKSSGIPGCPTTTKGGALNWRQYATEHSGGANFLFGDGHVKWMSPETASKVQCEAAAQIPFRQ